MANLVETLLGESEVSPDSLLAEIKTALNGGDLQTAIHKTNWLCQVLKTIDVKQRASSADTSHKPRLSKIKEAAVSFFKKGSWDDESLLGIKAATNYQDLVDAIAEFADAIGDRKGYGDEGKGELEGEFQSKIAEMAGDPDYFDYGDDPEEDNEE